MAKKDLATMALLGLTSGLLVSCQGQKQDKPKQNSGLHQMQMSADEQIFYKNLNAWGKKQFEIMNREQRAMVTRVAASGCRARNLCRGLGGCRTEHNKCSGQNQCRGHGGCKVSPNKAVELVKDQS